MQWQCLQLFSVINISNEMAMAGCNRKLIESAAYRRNGGSVMKISLGGGLAILGSCGGVASRS